MSELFSTSRRFAARVGALLLLALVLLAAQTVYLALDLARLRGDLGRAQEADAALTALQQAGTDLLDAETGQRGYLLTGDDAYLAPYLAARTHLRNTLQHALPATPPDERYAADIGRLAFVSALKLEELGRAVALRKGGDLPQENRILHLEHGKASMDEARLLILGAQQRIGAERARLRLDADVRLERAAWLVLAIGASVVVLLVCGWRALRARSSVVASRATQLVEDALHDRLTGLPNRRFFDSTAGQALKQAERGSGAFALLLIDLDGVARINDTHGRAVGDAVLLEAARRIATVLRGGEFLARLGGDEFALVVNAQIARQDLLGLGERIVAAMHPALHAQLADYTVASSIGVATARAGAFVGLDDLLAAADSALYAAKRAGRGVVRFHAERPLYSAPPAAGQAA